MYVEKNFSFKGILGFAGWHATWICIWISTVVCLYVFTDWKWLFMSWLPVSIVGTAVAFYVGFKNNQAYDRLWEARKIWGGIVNYSRTWSMDVLAFVSTKFTDQEYTEEELNGIKRRLIYRHIAWLYTLRSQLLIPTEWEHINQNKHVARLTKKRVQSFGIGLFEDELAQTVNHCLNQEEFEKLKAHKNPATQIINRQSKHLQELRENDLIDDFRHMELQRVLEEFYNLQGKCERIKKFPLPRQYGAMSFVFVMIFIFLLPFGLIPEFAKLGTFGLGLSIPVVTLVGWVYMVMELIGDYSENPFEGMGNDIPMFSLCRTIEIDLREMLGETELPPAVTPKNGVLM